MQHLEHYGWNPWFQNQLAKTHAALDTQIEHDALARVIQEHKEAYLVQTAYGKLWAEISGKIRHTAAVRADFPAVGDWVFLRGLQYAIDRAKSADPTTTQAPRNGGPVQITAILPRRTTLSRRLEKDAGGDDQILATNVDLAFLGSSVNENFNLRRLERYITLAKDAGAQPIVLLTKADLCDDPAPFITEVQNIAPPNTPIHPISVVSNQGLDALRTLLVPGITAVILGSSGIGKSTLVNHLAQADIMDMMDTRDFDDKGRHCTTFRHLVRTPTGGLIIDTPGLRGLSLGESADAQLSTFTDIESLTHSCKFTNCQHASEPGCAIKAALENKTLDPSRLESYLKLHRELAAINHRENRVATRKKNKLEKRTTAYTEEKQKFRWHGRQ